ncbi:MAG: lysylphosphatidylglycerol synthase transmembrane domain-containing protein [Chloroflexota bacterium]
MSPSVSAAKRTPTQRFWQWVNIIIAIGLTAVGVWFIGSKTGLDDIIQAFALAQFRYILLGLLVVMATLWLKNWRWQLLLTTPGEGKPPFIPLFWASTLGQYVNLVLPFVRLGEIARIYTLSQHTDIGAARALGTLVVEKTLDFIFFTLTLLIILPLVVLPDFVGDPSTLLGTIAFVLLIVLYLLAYQTAWTIKILRWICQKLPAAIGNRLLRIGVDGLEGLAALRNPLHSLYLVSSSLIVALLSGYLPYILFPAFGLSLGFLEGMLVHVVIAVVSVPPSTPGKIGVFNSAVALLLLSLGVENEAAIASYSIAFHLVAMLPIILLGVVAASRTRWRWRTS